MLRLDTLDLIGMEANEAVRKEAAHSALLAQGWLHPDRGITLYAPATAEGRVIGAKWAYAYNGVPRWEAHFVVVLRD